MDLQPLAYLDPLSGSVLIQLLLAGTAGFVVFFKTQKHRVVTFITGKRKSSEDDDAPDTEES